MALRLFLIILVISAALVPCFARRDAAAGWSRIETDNFEFVGNADIASIRSIAERLERFRNALGRVIHFPASSVRTRVIVFKDAAAFAQFKPKRADGAPDARMAGLYIPGDDLDHIAIAADGDLSIVYHEYVHDVIDSQFERAQVPPWLNEGLAEFFETAAFNTDGSVTFGTVSPARLKILRERKFVPLSEFFALDNFTLHQGDDASRDIFYAQSWAVAAYLIGRSRALPPEHNQSRDTIRPSRLKQLADETVHPAIEKGVVDLIAGTAPTGFTVRLTGAPPLFRANATAFPESSANAALGDLLYRLRDAAAENYLRRAIELDPRSATAYATLGLVRLRERKFAESRVLIERAANLDSSNHLVHFNRAFLSVQESMDEAGFIGDLKPEALLKIRESLARSIKLNPSFAESHRLLAFVELASGGDLVAAEKAAKTASELQPGNQDGSLLLAQLYARQEKLLEAVAIANRLFAAPANPRIKAEAQSLLNVATAIARAKQDESTGTVKVRVAGRRPPTILQYRDLTPEQLARIDAERENYNFNLLVERPGDGETHALGTIDRIACDDGQIRFSIKTATERLTLRARKFDDLRFSVAVPGTRSFAFRCDSRMPDDNALVVYRGEPRPGSDGEITAITFVPKDFVYRTREELIAAPFVIVEGRPGGDISGNAKEAAAAREAMEREMRETQMSDIEERLRVPQPGDVRVIGVPESLTCQNGRINVSVKVGDEIRQFSAPISKPFEVQSFNSQALLVELGCRAKLPSVPAVITYRGGELVAVEFVPTYFKLR